MKQVNEKDWKLFRSRLPGWQEAYMGKLIEEYKALLNIEGQASERFWALEKRVKQDRRNPGVLLRQFKKSESLSVWKWVRIFAFPDVSSDGTLGRAAGEQR